MVRGHARRPAARGLLAATASGAEKPVRVAGSARGHAAAPDLEAELSPDAEARRERTLTR